MRKLLIAFVVALTCLGLNAQAETKSYTQSVPVSVTNWNHVLAFQQFDPTLGTLNNITFSMTSSCQGQSFAENLSTQGGCTFNWELSALVQLKRPDGSVLLQVKPYVASPVYNLAVFDGNRDFGGTSGITEPKTCSRTFTLTTPPPASDIDLFTGTGMVNLTATATALSKVFGGGNIMMGASTKAGVDATITYDYTPVPEPAGLIAILTGLSGLLLNRRRR